LPRQRTVTVIDPQKVRYQPERGIFVRTAFAIGKRNGPECLKKRNPVFMGHCFLEGARETHGVGSVCFQHFRLLAKRDGGKGTKAEMIRKEAINRLGLRLVKLVIGTRDAHQKCCKREPRRRGRRHIGR